MRTVNIFAGVCLLAVMLAFYGCRRQFEPGPEPGSSTGAEKEIVFSLSLPATSLPGRALDDADENEVRSIQVLVFETDADGGGYLYTAFGRDITTAPGNPSQKTFTVTLRAGEFRLMLLTNANQWISECFPGGMVKGTSRSAIQQQLTASADRKWNTYSASPDYACIPMWGEIDEIEIDEDTEITGAKAVKLTRMLAKVDVQVGALAKDDFQLRSVHVYNRNKRGTLIPAPGSWNPAAGKAIDASVPAGAGVPPGDTLLYHGAEITDPNLACTGEIYLFEAEAGSRASYRDNTCLVIGGIYDGKLNYYRVDFIENAGDQSNYIPVMRNHRYRVTIRTVSGPGFPDPDEAFESLPINIQTDIMAWDESGMNDMDFDSQYQLVVDKSEFQFYAEGREQTLKIYTDHPSGWKVLDEDKPTWLSLTQSSDNSGTSVEVGLSAGAIAAPATDRDGYFYITAGRLKKKIKLLQTVQPELTIDVYPSQMTFRRTAAQIKEFNVVTYPPGADVYFSLAGTDPSHWLASPLGLSGTANQGTYNLRPNQNTGTEILNSVLTVYIQSGLNIASKTITIRQLLDDPDFSATPLTFAAAGGAVSMHVVSELTWKVQGKTDPASMIGNGYDTGEQAAGTVTFPFTLQPNPGFAERQATFHIASSDPDFKPQDVTITQGFVPPAFSLGTQTVNFGAAASPGAQAVKVTSNARWRMTALDANYNNVVSGSSIALNTDAGSTSALVTPDMSVSFTPRAYGADASTPAAGTPYSTKVRFSTVNHGSAGEITQDLTLSRTVPTLYSEGAITGLGTHAWNTQVTVTATVSTNAAWNLEARSLAWGTGNTGAGAYGTKTASVTIPIHDNSWTARTYQIYTTGNYRGVVTHNPRYSFGNPRIVSGSVDGTGGSYVIAVDGNHPGVTLTCWTDANQTVGSGSIPAGQNQGTLTIQTGADAARTIHIGYNHPQTGTRTPITSVTQPQSPYNFYGWWIERTDRYGTHAQAVSGCPAGWQLMTLEVQQLINKYHRNSPGVLNLIHTQYMQGGATGYPTGYWIENYQPTTWTVMTWVPEEEYNPPSEINTTWARRTMPENHNFFYTWQNASLHYRCVKKQ